MGQNASKGERSSSKRHHYYHQHHHHHRYHRCRTLRKSSEHQRHRRVPVLPPIPTSPKLLLDDCISRATASTGESSKPLTPIDSWNYLKSTTVAGTQANTNTQGSDPFQKKRNEQLPQQQRAPSLPVKVQRTNRRNSYPAGGTFGAGKLLQLPPPGQHNAQNPTVSSTNLQDPSSYLQKMYDSRTWEMYHRIICHRGQIKSNTGSSSSSCSGGGAEYRSGSIDNNDGGINRNGIDAKATTRIGSTIIQQANKIIGTTTASTDQQSTMSEPALLRRVRTTRTMFAATDRSSNAVHNNSNTIMTDDDDYAIGGSVRAEHEYDHYSAPMPSHYYDNFCTSSDVDGNGCFNYGYSRSSNNTMHNNNNNNDWEHMYGDDALDDDCNMRARTPDVMNANTNGGTSSSLHQQHETVFLFDF